jgi:rod shape-determining protein MreC
MINDSPRRRLPRWASGAIVALLAVALLTPGPWRQVEPVSSGVLAPIQVGISGTVDQLTTVVDTVQQVRGLSEQNSEYRDQIAQLQSEVVNMHELEVENSQLRDLLGMAQRTSPGELLPVSVIARDDTPYVQAVTIDRGTTGGVHEGSIVITHSGLVGRVESADPTSAKVRLITDINQSVAVRLQSESRSTGVLRGQSQGNLLVVTYIPQADTIRVGDPVLTSGLGEVFPENLVVGKVARVEHTDADPYQTAVVEPAVAMDKLEQMYVIADAKAAGSGQQAAGT